MAKLATNRFFNWLGSASFGLAVGVIAGAILGLVILGGCGAYFWYTLVSDDVHVIDPSSETIFGFLVTVALAVAGAIGGMVAGGIAGFTASAM